MTDHYKILGINISATKEEIKKAYHKLVKMFHPDRNPGNKEFEEKMKGINTAYETLYDEERRGAFDTQFAQYQAKRANGQSSNYQYPMGRRFTNVQVAILLLIFLAFVYTLASAKK